MYSKRPMKYSPHANRNIGSFVVVVDLIAINIDSKLSATARRVTSKLDEAHNESGTLPDNARRVCFTLFSKLGTNATWPEIHEAF